MKIMFKKIYPWLGLVNDAIDEVFQVMTSKNEPIRQKNAFHSPIDALVDFSLYI
jgi:hypothetical protein